MKNEKLYSRAIKDIKNDSLNLMWMSLDDHQYEHEYKCSSCNAKYSMRAEHQFYIEYTKKCKCGQYIKIKVYETA